MSLARGWLAAARRGVPRELVDYAVSAPEEACAEFNTVVKFAKKYPLFGDVYAVFYLTEAAAGSS